MWNDITYELKLKMNFSHQNTSLTCYSIRYSILSLQRKNYNLLDTLGQLGFSAVKINLPDNTNESVPCKGLVHWDMLIKTLAYEKMNDLKDALDKSSQKWLC